MADNVSPFETQTHFLNEVSAFVLWKMILYFADVKKDTHIRLDSQKKYVIKKDHKKSEKNMSSLIPLSALFANLAWYASLVPSASGCRHLMLSSSWHDIFFKVLRNSSFEMAPVLEKELCLSMYKNYTSSSFYSIFSLRTASCHCQQSLISL